LKSIKTDRCNLRPFTLADIKPSYRINLDPDVTRYTNDGGVKTLPQMRETIANNVLSDYEKYGFGRFAVEDQATGNFIGFSGLKFIEDEDFFDIGYRLDKDYWGKGIATETAIASLQFGFNDLNLDKIYSWIMPANVASIRIMGKLNLKLDAQITEDGEAVDQYVLEKMQFKISS
jgi:ribosomal-protein-alanine N-acetyltransferase